MRVLSSMTKALILNHSKNILMKKEVLKVLMDLALMENKSLKKNAIF
jgi:hypothetical protein